MLDPFLRPKLLLARLNVWTTPGATYLPSPENTQRNKPQKHVFFKQSQKNIYGVYYVSRIWTLDTEPKRTAWSVANWSVHTGLQSGA